LKNRNNKPALLVFFLLIVLPFAAGMIYALMYSVGVIGQLSNGFTLANWEKTLTSSEVLISFLFSIYTAAVSIVLSVAFALFFVMKENGSGSKSRIAYFIYFPLCIPPLVAAFFTFQFLAKSGFGSRIFSALHLTNGIEGFPDLVNDQFGISIILTHLLLALPFFIILFQNYYRSEKLESLHELSSTLGSSTSQFRCKVLIPVLLNKTAAPIALYFIFMLGSYDIPLLLGVQNPQMISVLVNRKLSRFNLLDIPQGYALAIIYTMMVSILLLMIIRTKAKTNAEQAYL
jgi:putative spermidine/putrescine transport system permease protein